MDLSDAVMTDHARERAGERGITEARIREVLRSPQQVHRVRPGRVVAQSVIDLGLYRVFVDVDRRPPEVVTAYRTSKIDKYRSQR